MILRLWDTLLAYLRERPYWSRIQPLLTLLSLYLMAIVLGYQYIQWQYGLSPPLSLYLRSYLFRQVTVAFLALGAAAALLHWHSRREAVAARDQAGTTSRRWQRAIAPRLIIGGVVLVVAIPAFIYVSPKRVSHIHVKYLTEPKEFDGYAFVYLLYELNKRQRDWYFEVDFDVFNPDALTSRERGACAGHMYQSLCYATTLAEGRPFIGITSERLGEDYFWQNQGRVSVLSTFGWQQYAPPSTYAFLAYSTIVQSIVIHLNTHCTSLPGGSFRESRVAYGDLFQYTPRRTALKSEILAAHLSPKGEALLLNCFGVRYMATVSSLLTLDWLHSGSVPRNLKTAFRVMEEAAP